MFHSSISCASDNEQQLKKLQQNLLHKENSLQQEQQQRIVLLHQLQQQQQALDQSTKVLRQTKQKLNILNHDIEHLNSLIKKLQRDVVVQKKILGQQLDAVFRKQQQAKRQWLFSISNYIKYEQHQHLLIYFISLNREREKKIRYLHLISIQLSAKKKEQQQQQQQQNKLLQQQQQQQLLFCHARNTKQKMLNDLNTSIIQNEHIITQLRIAENKLRNTIAYSKRQLEKNAKIAANHTQLLAVTPPCGLTLGQSIWPVLGCTIHSFGEPHKGDLRYKGLVIVAPEGSQVQAIADGQVIISDWLQGYGLIVAIEHGKGDMSIYGNNQSTLVHAGDYVKAGQQIAVIGSNKNSKISSLYFEIRRQGKAVNPIPWLRQ